MNPHKSIAVLAFAILASSCVTTNEANLHGYFKSRGLEVTQDGAPEGARPLEVISYYRSGFYLFGVVPIVPVELRDALDWLTKTAERTGADGIANLSFQFSPASFWKFTLFPIPDWSSWIHVSGMAYELPAEGADESRLSAVTRAGDRSSASRRAP